MLRSATKRCDAAPHSWFKGPNMGKPLASGRARATVTSGQANKVWLFFFPTRFST